MKIFKKIAAFVAAAAIVVAALPTAAFAADWKSTAINAPNGKEITFTLPDYGKGESYLKVDLKQSGYLVLDIESKANYTYLQWSSNGDSWWEFTGYHVNWGSHTCHNSWSAGYDNYLKWDDTAKKFSGSFSREFSKGTYYIRLYRDGGLGTGKVKLTAHYYDSQSTLCNAKTASSGKTYTESLNVTGSETVYKYNVSKSGTLNVKLDVSGGDYDYTEVALTMYKGSDDEEVEIENINGEGFKNYDIMATVGKDTSVDLSYKVTKGTYYLRVAKTSKYDTEISTTATFPEGKANNGKISYLTLGMSKGSSLKLGTVMSVDGTVTWSSSNSSVVSVSSSGKITAKAKGTAIITAKTGKNSVKIKITVS